MYHFLFTLDADELEKIKVAASESRGITYKKYETKEDMDELESDVQEFITRRDVLKEKGLTVDKFLEGKPHVTSSFYKYTCQNPSNRRALPNGKIVLARGQTMAIAVEEYEKKEKQTKEEEKKKAVAIANAVANANGKIVSKRVKQSKKEENNQRALLLQQQLQQTLTARRSSNKTAPKKKAEKNQTKTKKRENSAQRTQEPQRPNNGSKDQEMAEKALVTEEQALSFEEYEKKKTADKEKEEAISCALRNAALARFDSAKVQAKRGDAQVDNHAPLGVPVVSNQYPAAQNVAAPIVAGTFADLDCLYPKHVKKKKRKATDTTTKKATKKKKRKAADATTKNATQKKTTCLVVTGSIADLDHLYPLA